MQILFEDPHIVVCIKPAGVLSQFSPGKANMVALLREQTGGEVFPVHRLDREVGGVMVYGKTQKAAAALSKQIAQHSFEKTYLARVHGVPDSPQGEMEDLLFKDSAKNKVFVVRRERKGVKTAKLAYEVLSVDETGNALVKIRLFTGRTHQIRVQFASRKHPLLGDGKYGARDGEPRLHLRSQQIAFDHPETGERMRWGIENEEWRMEN